MAKKRRKGPGRGRGKGPSPAKARQMLHDRQAQGHPLTDRQRRFFGAVASGAATRRKARKPSRA
jgi:hypothetical protein